MPSPTHVRRFVSNTPEYHDAFAAFLAHTDQKERAMEWLNRAISRLPQRKLFIDAGAGTGKLTAQLGQSFDRVAAIEPNPTLVDDLRQACPTAEIFPTTITEATPPTPANFILCSHVFYYIPKPDWDAHADHLANWLATGGELVIAIQNPGTDCMNMIQHFIGSRFDLGELRHSVEARWSGRFTAEMETVNAAIRTPDLQTACIVGEFVLNSMPMTNPPLWADLEAYIDSRHRQPDGSYRMSCHQDFLRITRK